MPTLRAARARLAAYTADGPRSSKRTTARRGRVAPASSSAWTRTESSRHRCEATTRPSRIFALTKA